ncbi:hypothetical protein F2Q69_00034640 [Brassica cretica]|uniref:Uncharacterized protein n=1 Tax=Brassica cretica TaxID=69181 RepID=A0A8S9SW79_BRACR|nr:hypothetical protein F2Q69_00034640 [Brassica cretica]
MVGFVLHRNRRRFSLHHQRQSYSIAKCKASLSIVAEEQRQEFNAVCRGQKEFSKLIDDSSEKFDDSGEIRRLRRFPRRDLMIPTTLTSDEIWRRLQAQTNRTISLHERVTKVMMIEICSICGEWKLINGIQWDFIVDDQRGSSLRMIHEDISYNDLIVAVLEDFGIDGTETVEILAMPHLQN